MTQWIAKKDDILGKWGRGKRFNPPFKPKAGRLKRKDFAKAAKALAKGDEIGPLVIIDGWHIPWNAQPKADPKKPFLNGWSFGAKLVSRGYKKLGNGCFSTVYAKSDDKVIKVTTVLDPWIEYCVWAAEKGYAGKFAPKVYSYKKFKGKDGNEFAVSVVERMEKGFYNVEAKEDAYCISALMWPACRGNKMAQLYLDDLSPGLPKFLLDFHEKFGKEHTDIGGNNMMLRKDGSFCLTDPLAGRPSADYKRLRSKDFMSFSKPLKELLIEGCFRY